jgi:hypothetical protein
VVCEPNEQQPARPIAASDQKHSADYRKKPDEQNPYDVIFKRTLRLELPEVVRESDGSSYYEYATDDRD